MNLMKTTGTRLTTGVASLLLAGGSLVGLATAPAQAAQVNNMYLCDPATGWCYQTNPPYNPNFPRACQWDDNVRNLYSGMWYTGCTPGYWGPYIH